MTSSSKDIHPQLAQARKDFHELESGTTLYQADGHIERVIDSIRNNVIAAGEGAGALDASGQSTNEEMMTRLIKAGETAHLRTGEARLSGIEKMDKLRFEQEFPDSARFLDFTVKSIREHFTYAADIAQNVLKAPIPFSIDATEGRIEKAVKKLLGPSS